MFDCAVPIISAVGHETDTTIIDYVADLRAPTPSAAAELAVYEAAVLEERLAGAAGALTKEMRRITERNRMLLENYRLRLQKANPIHRVHEQRNRLIGTEERLSEAMSRRLQNTRHRLALYIEKMKGLSPLGKLNQGYAYVADGQGHTVSSIEQVAAGDAVFIYVTDGVVEAQTVGVRRAAYTDRQTLDKAEEES